MVEDVIRVQKIPLSSLSQNEWLCHEAHGQTYLNRAFSSILSFFQSVQCSIFRKIVRENSIGSSSTVTHILSKLCALSTGDRSSMSKRICQKHLAKSKMKYSSHCQLSVSESSLGICGHFLSTIVQKKKEKK